MNPKTVVIFAAVMTTTMAATAVLMFFFGLLISDLQKNTSFAHAAAVSGGIFLSAVLTFAWYFFGAIRAFFLKIFLEEMR